MEFGCGSFGDSRKPLGRAYLSGKGRIGLEVREEKYDS